MSRAALASPITLLRSSWRYFWKHSALQRILLWFFILPEALQMLLASTNAPPPLLVTAYREWQLAEFLSVLGSLALGIIMLWGSACVLLIGKRMIQNRAGRSRTSFRSVRKDALPLIVPLFLTSLLQVCFLFYRSLLYIIPASIALYLVASGRYASVLSLSRLPGIFLALTPLLIPAFLYYCRTFFYSTALVTEEVKYRGALRRSSELVTGKILPLLWRVVFLSLFTVLPSSVLSSAIDYALPAPSTAVLILSVIIRSALLSFGSVFFVLATVALFGSLRNLREVPRR